jgi:hypothetical protein
MILAVLMLGWVSNAAGDDPPADGAVAPAFAYAVEFASAWDRAADRGPRRDERSLFLCEEEDEDGSLDDGPSDARHGFASMVPDPSQGLHFAGRAPWQVTSRSSTPTIRLRC